MFAVSHICPVMTTLKKDDVYDIERDIYSCFNAELERLKVDFMISGHVDKAFILSSNDEKSVLPHNYPVVFGSETSSGNFIGAGFTLFSDSVLISFTDAKLHVKSTFRLYFRK